MRAFFEHIEPTAPLSWKLFRRQEPRFDFQWHFHHEYELTFIARGSGTRIVGDSVQPYEPGDLTLIGPGMPHTYVSASGGTGQAAVIAQFRGDFLGKDLFGRREFGGVAGLLARAARGIVFPPGTADLAPLAELPPAERTVELLRTLVRLSACEQGRLLAGGSYAPVLNRASGDRIDAMVRLLQGAYTRAVTLEEVAEAAHMAPGSASRFFRRTTGTTITGYVNSLRVEAACVQLRDTERRIADIAGDCGYANLANFNRRFRALKHTTPREYRRSFRTAGSAGA